MWDSETQQKDMSPRLPTERTEITRGDTQVRTKGGVMPTVWKQM
jgi:hypothetical protein